MKKIAIIGAGVYGCWIAFTLSKKGYEISIFEKNNEIISESSKLNQYRIHRGYHYLKSLNTAYRCQINYNRFLSFFPTVVFSDFESYYGIAKANSNITTNNFEKICNILKLPFTEENNFNERIFNPHFIEKLFRVDEKIYNVIELRKKLLELIDHKNITTFLNTEVEIINDTYLKTNKNEKHNFDYVFNCTYSDIGQFKKISEKKLDLTYVLSEIGVIKMPDKINNLGVTIIDGPFFSVLPMDKELHTISHVQFTHLDRNDKNIYSNKKKYLNEKYHYINTKKMILDASRYMPILKDAKMKKSFFQVKTLSKLNKSNDSRPIIIEKYQNCFNIIGSKIDNVFDVSDYLERYL